MDLLGWELGFALFFFLGRDMDTIQILLFSMIVLAVLIVAFSMNANMS
jgi:hypothetical protein